MSFSCRRRAALAFLGLSGVLVAAGCTGSQEVSPSEQVSVNQSVGGASESRDSVLKGSEVVAQASNIESNAPANSLPSDALADAAGVPKEQVSELITNQGIKIELVEKLEGKFPDEITYIWATDPLMKDLHVSAKSQEALDFAKKEVPSVETHLTKYSYSEIEGIRDKIYNLIESGFGSEGKSFVKAEPIESKIYLGLVDLTEEQKRSKEYSEIQNLIKKYPDLIMISQDVEKYGNPNNDSELLKGSR